MEVQRYTIMDRLGQWVKYDDIKHLLNVPEGRSSSAAESYPQLSDVSGIASETIHELREIFLDFNSSKEYQDKQVRDWIARNGR